MRYIIQEKDDNKFNTSGNYLIYYNEKTYINFTLIQIENLYNLSNEV